MCWQHMLATGFLIHILLFLIFRWKVPAYFKTLYSKKLSKLKIFNFFPKPRLVRHCYTKTSGSSSFQERMKTLALVDVGLNFSGGQGGDKSTKSTYTYYTIG